MMSLDGEGLKVRPAGLAFSVLYSKRHNKFLFPALAGAIYGSTCKAENEISNVVNYSLNTLIFIILYSQQNYQHEFRACPGKLLP